MSSFIKHLKLIPLFPLTLLVGTAARTQEIDVLAYQFSLNLTDENDTVKGLAVITYVKKTIGETVAIDLASINKDGKGMRVLYVAANATGSTLSFTHVSNKILVNTPQVKQGDTSALFIGYKGIPDDGLIISKNKYGDRTFFADNWPNRAHHWVPCNDRPDDKAVFEFRITAPAQYEVVSNGRPNGKKLLPDETKRTTWREDIPSPTKVMVIGAARFATKVFDDSPKEIPVSAWVYPQDSAKGFYDYALTTDILKFFSGYIAPYPYKKLANVQSKTIFGGMENASCIFYAENSVTGDRSEEDLYAHEIAHQWFGDMASEKSFAHLWLSEGFATYMTDVYFEHKYGKEAMNKRLRNEREEAIAFAKKSTHPVVDTASNLMSLLNANSYQKGAWVLHMLRQEAGDSVFHKIIQTYYNQYKGGNADTRDFEAVAEKVSGKDLKWFFDQWLYRSGLPKLSFHKVVDANGVSLIVEQFQKEPYRFMLPVSVDVPGMEEVSRLHPVASRKQILRLSSDKNAAIKFSPADILLYEEVK